MNVDHVDVDLVDVDLDVDLVDVDLIDGDLVAVDLVVFLLCFCPLAVLIFLSILSPGCFLGFWPPAVLKFLAPGCI